MIHGDLTYNEKIKSKMDKIVKSIKKIGSKL